MTEGLWAILLTGIANICLVAFLGGKLWQKVNDNCRRLTRLEGIINSRSTKKGR